jgi:CRP-like cAMP-binding protein
LQVISPLTVMPGCGGVAKLACAFSPASVSATRPVPPVFRRVGIADVGLQQQRERLRILQPVVEQGVEVPRLAAFGHAPSGPARPRHVRQRTEPARWLGQDRPLNFCSAPRPRSGATPLTLAMESIHRVLAAHTHALAMRNRVLAALPGAELRTWLAHMEIVDLPLGTVLYEPGGLQSHAYFPTTAIVSLLFVLENGNTAEIAVVGHEGLVGISLFMGGGSTPSRAVVQSAGQGLRLPAQALMESFGRAGPVTQLLLRYTQALITQMAQTAACNRHHSLDNQLCRWLLMSLDRLEGNELVMTQKLIADMLGVRREGVTEAALKLQRTGMIRYIRGRITVMDRPALERRCCECYEVVRREYERLLPAAGGSAGID